MKPYNETIVGLGPNRQETEPLQSPRKGGALAAGVVPPKPTFPTGRSPMLVGRGVRWGAGQDALDDLLRDLRMGFPV